MGEELISGTSKWHAVRTRAGAEAKAFIGIGAAGMQVFLPVELIRLNLRGRSEVRWRALFPAHLFVTLNPSRDLPRLLTLDGIDAVLKRDGKLVPVADDVVSAIRRAERDGLFDAAAGCRVPDDDAPPPDARFAGLMTKIKRARWSKERTKLLMSLMVSR